ncbi:uncharacterized protein F5147DRAFT_772439 [Suillus discolor]|uniref:Uncharacterized protein n=1 Tax=Suillus discolor TaxID=1912936 RepID=A0A9P7FAR3_9AGAM|nr:uncharacterized protein F5147DRAFT_772439 [Suillus discolor]KAG2110657.1 hypothetical protein F5147DRAFT_772439 [Suillus discolor]
MAASSKPTEENWYPSNLLAYNALPAHQAFDSPISDAKSTADIRTDFYDRSLTSRRYALVGVACSSIFSCLCIIAGIVTLANHGIAGVTPLNMMDLKESNMNLSWLQLKIFSLILNLIPQSLGFVSTGPQPAAYGHVQTLANLVDEWSPVMWWGHKEDGIPYYHAGTSDHPLPDVKMDCVYAGSGAESPVSLS